ncbi:amino acid ABC transporter permease [Caproiciproducens sp. NJN-50]|uniref:amino acid ABC transporter permease n=1 Tax=Acutalibacteraceae TaxID=3082771 RepID=UPI000FFE0C7E|nr:MULTISPECIES: amino acid ABC transporter permease [Acutalibacteraceae]QAT50416.1 amino acid ABC transporter permease [Caproiciproducens sp. NJN-50]
MNWEFSLSTLKLALGGLPVTLMITAITFIISTPLAFLIAIVRLKEIHVIDKICKVYISFIRGTPMLVQIYVIYTAMPSILSGVFQSFHIPIRIFDVNPILYAFIVFVLNIAATMSEILRSALGTVNKGQLEAAYTAGLTSFQGYRRIVIPQALVSAIPNLCTLTTGLIKGTSLVFAMGILDVTAIAKIQASSGYYFIEAYLDIFLIYLVLCFSIEKIFSLIEWKLKNHPKIMFPVWSRRDCYAQSK